MPRPKVADGQGSVEALGGENESGRFKPPRKITNQAQGLRIMTHRKGEPKERVNPPLRRRTAAVRDPETITVYIAGAVHSPPRTRASAAAGFFVAQNENQSGSKCLPSLGEQSQIAAEFFAALKAIRSAGKNTALTIFSTQNHVHDAMNKKLPSWEHEG
jgi:hypothetical protein